MSRGRHPTPTLLVSVDGVRGYRRAYPASAATMPEDSRQVWIGSVSIPTLNPLTERLGLTPDWIIAAGAFKVFQLPVGIGMHGCNSFHIVR